MKKLLENIGAPTPEKWRQRGYVALYMIAPVVTLLEQLPFTPEQKQWVTPISAFLLTIYSLFTHTKVDKQKYQGNV